MKFTVEKTENCFVGAQTYAYSVPLAMSEAALGRFAPFGVLELKRNYRRPFYFIRGNGMEIKGLLGDTRFKVSYPEEAWESDKAAFEKFLEDLPHGE